MAKKPILRLESVLTMAVAAAVLVAAGALLQFAFAPSSCIELTGTINEGSLPDRQKADIVKQFVDAGVAKASWKDVPRQQLLDELTKERSSLGGYLIGYQTETDGSTKIGTLVLHGVATSDFCDASHPQCDDSKRTEVGKDLYDFKTLDGVHEVQLWMQIAKNGGGWVAYYWKDQQGKIAPKYVYIKGVPNRKLLLASGYFAE